MSGLGEVAGLFTRNRVIGIVFAGVLFAGIAPAVADTTVTLGSPGDGGTGGDPAENDGIDGVAEQVLEAP